MRRVPRQTNSRRLTNSPESRTPSCSQKAVALGSEAARLARLEVVWRALRPDEQG